MCCCHMTSGGKRSRKRHASGEFYECLTPRRDELFEPVDAVLCADGAVKYPVDSTLLPEHRRGHGAMYGGLNHGRLDTARLRTMPAGLPLPRFDGGRLVAADDTTAVTAAQLRSVVERLIAAGQWRAGDPHIVIVSDAGYDVTRLAWVLRDLPVEMVGRIRSDRVRRLPKPPRMHGVNGRPPKHGPEFRLTEPETWPEPAITTATDTTNYGKAETQAWDRATPGSRTAPPGSTTTVNYLWSRVC